MCGGRLNAASPTTAHDHIMFFDSFNINDMIVLIGDVQL